jgi:formylmethanofuran dehydrogenase subunit A
MLAKVPAKVRERCTLPELDREYSLYEIAIITRAAPARMLGLAEKGHLGPGADADITIYRNDRDYQKMFEVPRYVLRAGVVVVEDGEIREPVDGKLLHVAPSYDEDAVPDIQTWLEQNYTIRFRNYPVDDSYLNEHQVIPTT